MPSTDAPRLLLFADATRAAAPATPARIRRYRLARLPAPGAARRPDGEPRYAYLKHGHD
jgi:hypothetical protein